MSRETGLDEGSGDVLRDILKKSVITFAAAAALAGCATEAKIAETPSGRPERVFHSATAADIGGRIASNCMNNGLMVMESGPSHVVCGKTMEGGDAVLTQMLIGNSYSTPPQQKVRFNIVQIGPDVRVQAMQWVETQMALGQTRQQELNSGAQFNSLQRYLNTF